MGEHHYYGKYRGKVTNTTDPEHRLRIKAYVPDVLGSEESNWALPCLPPGWPTLFQSHVDPQGGTDVHQPLRITPRVNDDVWIEFEGGDVEHPVWVGVWRRLAYP